jgi:N-acetylmuramoyl-L-alanine amidase
MLGSATESEEEEGVFELETSLSEATEGLEDEEFQVGADITKADDTVSEEVAGETKPREHPKPPVSREWTSTNYNSRKGTDIDAIVLHHTGGRTAASAASELTRKHEDPKKDVSAHYVIDKDGTIYQLVEDEYRAWHAGGNLDGQDCNNRSIGIEIVHEGDDDLEFTEAQYESLNKLIPYLKEEYDIPDENIVAHRQVSKLGKPDPAKLFDWERVVPGGPSGSERKPGDRYDKPQED